MYLPFGYRFEDDNAFVRQLSGINMQAPDEGVEFGFETGLLEHAVRVQQRHRLARLKSTTASRSSRARSTCSSAWRVGVSAVSNDTDAGDRLGAGLFGAFRTRAGHVVRRGRLLRRRQHRRRGPQAHGLAGRGRLESARRDTTSSSRSSGSSPTTMSTKTSRPAPACSTNGRLSSSSSCAAGFAYTTASRRTICKTANRHSCSCMGSSRPLRDAPDRSYARKLERFASFAAPELKRKIFARAWARTRGARACSTSAAASASRPPGWPSCSATRRRSWAPTCRCRTCAAHAEHRQRGWCRLTRETLFPRCDVRSHLELQHHQPPRRSGRRCCAQLRAAVAAGGRMVLAQSGFLPEMFFAWDAPLDEAVRRACHRLLPRALWPDDGGHRRRARIWSDCVQRGGFAASKRVHTMTIERIQPLSDADRDYFCRKPFSTAPGASASDLCRPTEQWHAPVPQLRDPASAEYCLDREDFHHVQTLTVCESRA